MTVVAQARAWGCALRAEGLDGSAEALLKPQELSVSWEDVHNSIF